MSPSFKLSSHATFAVPTSPVRPVRWALTGLLCAALAACGGGGGGDAAPAGAAPAGGGVGGTGGATTQAGPTATAYAAGPIDGFGSVIVNGVRYDDSAARILDDDGTAFRGGDRARLRLGMRVEVGSAAVDDSTGRAKAESVRVGSELVGTVSAVTKDGSGAVVSFVLLGQTVLIQRPGTVIDDSITGGFAGITVGNVLEVHASFNGTAYLASFIEDRSTAALSRFKIRGVVSALDTTAKTFRIGNTTVSYASLASGNALPATLPTLANGLLVRVELGTTAGANGVLTALSLRSGQRTADQLTSSSAVGDARLRGTVSKAVVNATFELDGVAVQIDSSTRFDKGSLADLVVGALVDVRGVLRNGVLVAERVKLRKAEDNSRATDDNPNGGIELHGTASEIDTAANRFTLTHSSGTRYTVSYVLDFDAIVRSSPKLEVKGLLSTDGKGIQALLIKRED